VSDMSAKNSITSVCIWKGCLNNIRVTFHRPSYFYRDYNPTQASASRLARHMTGGEVLLGPDWIHLQKFCRRPRRRN